MFVNNQEDIIHQIESHADACIPNECCGLVLKHEDGFEYLALNNEAEAPQRAFKINPIIIAQHYDRIAYIVHSHVNGSARASARDVEKCDKLRKPFLIVSVPEGRIFTIFPKTFTPEMKGPEFFCGANDCVTTVRDFYKTEFAMELYDPIRLKYGWWSEKTEETESETLRSATQHGFHVVETPLHGDIIIMRLATPVPAHWAVYLGNGDILQNSLTTGRRQSTYNSFWRKHTVCFMRHHERD